MKDTKEFCEVILNKPVFIEFKTNSPFKRMGGIIYNTYKTEVDIFLELIDTRALIMYLIPLSTIAMIDINGKRLDKENVESES